MKASKKLITASVALVASLAVSVGSTFAWFTTSNFVTVGGIQATVTTTESDVEVRQVAADGSEITNWGYGLVLNLDEETKNLKLDALSDPENDGLSLYNRVNYSALLAKKATSGEEQGQGQSAPITAVKPNSEGGFLEFYLEFRTKDGTASEGGSVSLKLGAASSVNATDGERETITGWSGINTEEGYYGSKVAEYQKIEASAADAVRIGFYKIDDYFDNEDDDMEITDSATLDEAIGVWAPNEYYYSGKQYDGEGDDEENDKREDGGKGYYKHNLAADYEQYLVLNNIHSETELEKNGVNDLYENEGYSAIKEDSTTIVTINEDMETAGVYDADTMGVGYKYARVCVRMWIEGRDGDCFNNIFNDHINATLLFTIDKGEED